MLSCLMSTICSLEIEKVGYSKLRYDFVGIERTFEHPGNQPLPKYTDNGGLLLITSALVKEFYVAFEISHM